MAKILVVEDDPSVAAAVAMLLGHHGHSVTSAASGKDAIAVYVQDRPDLTLLDLTLPDTSGVDLLKNLREHDPKAIAIFLTAFATVRSAVEAIRAGGFDFLTKPFDNEELVLTISRALEFQKLNRRVAELEAGLEARESFSTIVGASDAIRNTVRLLAKVAKVDAPVLLLGESGTGKELAATSIHRHSARATRPFIAINCAALPPTLAESELFGHERGAFTDARETRTGRFEQANGGTLFLDEIGDLPLELQAKLLRVLQEGQVSRIGSRRPIGVDVRLIAATNRDLDGMMKQGSFRPDLFFRLNTFPVTLPTLRERAVDLPLLVEHLIDRLNNRFGLSVQGISDAAMARLRAHSWPGNIRELENVLSRAMILTDGVNVEEQHLPALDTLKLKIAAEEIGGTLEQVVERGTRRIERALIQNALHHANGNRTRAATLLGISRRTLFTKLKHLRLVEDEGDDQSDGMTT